jgi:hypothetical protein
MSSLRKAKFRAFKITSTFFVGAKTAKKIDWSIIRQVTESHLGWAVDKGVLGLSALKSSEG